MDWLTDNPHPGYVSATAEAKDWKGLADDYRAFLIKLGETVAAHMADGEWDRLYIDYVISQGTIFGFPHNRGSILTKRKCQVSIYSPYVLEQYNAILDAEGADDAAIEFGIGKLLANVRLALSKYKNKEDVRRVYRQLRERTDYAVWEMFDGDIERLVPLYFL